MPLSLIGVDLIWSALGEHYVCRRGATFLYLNALMFYLRKVGHCHAKCAASQSPPSPPSMMPSAVNDRNYQIKGTSPDVGVKHFAALPQSTSGETSATYAIKRARYRAHLNDAWFGTFLLPRVWGLCSKASLRVSAPLVIRPAGFFFLRSKVFLSVHARPPFFSSHTCPLTAFRNAVFL